MLKEDSPNGSDLDQALAIERTGTDRNQAGSTQTLRANADDIVEPPKPPKPDEVPPPPKPPQPPQPSPQRS